MASTQFEIRISIILQKKLSYKCITRFFGDDSRTDLVNSVFLKRILNTHYFLSFNTYFIMLGLLSLCIYTLFSLFNPMLIAAIPQDSEPNSGSTQAILSILRAHGQASQDTYCYACRWAGQLGYQELPSDLARDFEQIGPDFIRFYRHVRSQLVKLNVLLAFVLYDYDCDCDCIYNLDIASKCNTDISLRSLPP